MWESNPCTRSAPIARPYCYALLAPNQYWAIGITFFGYSVAADRVRAHPSQFTDLLPTEVIFSGYRIPRNGCVHGMPPFGYAIDGLHSRGHDRQEYTIHPSFYAPASKRIVARHPICHHRARLAANILEPVEEELHKFVLRALNAPHLHPAHSGYIGSHDVKERMGCFSSGAMHQ